MANHTHKNIDHSEKQNFLGVQTELFFSILSGTLLAIGFISQIIDLLPQNTIIGIYIVSYFFGGFYTTKEAIHAMKHAHFEIDFLMLFAAIGAAILGEWAEGALLLFLFSLGHSLEHFAMNRARKSISALSNLTPPTAIILVNGEQKEVPVESLKINDIILIKPNSKIAADGLVILGNSFVNQSAITGESLAVQKFAAPQLDVSRFDKIPEENRVFAGTINGNMALQVTVSRIAEDSTLSKLIQMVSEAESQKSPTQHFTDKFQLYFVPIVLSLVLLLMFAFLFIEETFSQSFYRAMAVLVSASPCALAISTPSAVLAGIARAARSGILIKGGKPLETLGKIKSIAFDKTGTLTEGKPKLTEVIPLEGIQKNELLKTAAAVELLSDHPLAEAIAEGCIEKLGTNEIPNASKMEAITARGVKAIIENETVYIGNRLLMQEVSGEDVPQNIQKLMSELEIKGQTSMIVYRNNQYLGIVAVMDVPRKETKETLANLKKIGISKMVMLTGDHQNVANAIGSELGITDPMGNLLPEDKVNYIKNIISSENLVAMVGDGVNDAPAMALSSIGIAMGAAGSAVALETADIALMADRLDKLPFAIQLSRKTNTIIRQNLWISLGMVAILIPLTISGIASIGPAVIGHEGSTIVVVLNALRLLAVKEASF